MGININIYNAVLFYVAWLLCVTGGNYFAIVTCIVALAIHLRFISGEVSELLLIIQVALLGILVDTLFIVTGVMTGEGVATFPPLWLMSLWLIFATTLNHCLRWFQNQMPLAVIVGAVAGPLSYLAGTRMTAVEFGEPASHSMVILGLGWAIIFPVCLHLAKRYDKTYVAA
jgi:hypothetical protein